MLGVGAAILAGAVWWTYKTKPPTSTHPLLIPNMALAIQPAPQHVPSAQPKIQGAYQALSSLAGKPKSQTLELLRSLRANERTELLHQICRNSTGIDRTNQLHELFGAWATIDPIEAFEAAQGLLFANESNEATQIVFTNCSPENAAQLLHALDNNHDIGATTRQALADTALIKLSKIDTTAATGYIDNHSELHFSPQTMSGVAEDLGKAKGRAALAWAEGKIQLYGNDPLQGAVAGWANSDLSGATKYIQATTDLTRRTQLSSTVANRIALDNPSAAVEWSRAIPDADEREIVNLTIAAAFAYKDLSGAVAWVQNLPTEERASAISTVASEFAKQDPAKASDWVSTLSAGSERDIASETLAAQLASTSPETALSWALQVSESNRRTDAFLQVFRSWQSQDPMRANEWLKTSPLPVETKEYIRSTLSGGR
jgi:hypothetical protein